MRVVVTCAANDVKKDCGTRRAVINIICQLSGCVIDEDVKQALATEEDMFPGEGALNMAKQF